MEQLPEPLPAQTCETSIGPPAVLDEQPPISTDITVEVTPGDVDDVTDTKKPSDTPEKVDVNPPVPTSELDEVSLSTEDTKSVCSEEIKNLDAPEETENKDQKMSREMKSLIKSAKESKIINEYTQVKSKIRKSRVDADLSGMNGTLNSSVEVDKEPGSRRSSDNSFVSSSSDVSDKTDRRSIRSVNPDIQKQHKSLHSGQHAKNEGSVSKLDSENCNYIPQTNVSQTNSEDVEMESTCKSDKYCWRCHWLIEKSPSGVGPRHCSVCPRSYHPKCVSSKAGNPEKSDWVCPECMTVLNAEASETRSLAMQKTSLSTLCTLLNYALARMKLINGVEEFLQPVNLTQCPDYHEHVVHPMDLGKVQQNIVDGLYGSTEAFLADTLWILHNCLVYNSPVRSRLTVAARSLVRECRKEIGEIEACPECYAAAHARKPTWFTDVCSTPHILLWAKLKGFPFWPAKGMTVNEMGMVDVRFFGDHDRAWVPAKYCFLYSTKDPNNTKTQRQDILESIKEAEQHVKNIIRKFGSFVHAPPKTLFEPAKLGEQLKIMIPGYKGVLPISRFLKESTSNTSSPINKIKRSRSVSKGSKDDSRDGYLSDDDETDNITQDEDDVSLAESMREKSADVDVVSIDSSLKLLKTELKSKFADALSGPKRKRLSSSIEKSVEKDLSDKKEINTEDKSKQKPEQITKKRKLSVGDPMAAGNIENIENGTKQSSNTESSNNKTTSEGTKLGTSKLENKDLNKCDAQTTDSNQKFERKKFKSNSTDEIKKPEQKNPESKSKDEIKSAEQKKPENIKVDSMKSRLVTDVKKSPSTSLEKTNKIISKTTNTTTEPSKNNKLESILKTPKRKSNSSDSIFGSGDKLPTITSVRSLAGDEANSAFTPKSSSGKKDTTKQSLSKTDDLESSQKKNNNRRTSKTNQTQKDVNANPPQFFDVEIKTEPIDCDELNKTQGKNDLLESLHLRPTATVDSLQKTSESRNPTRTCAVKNTTPAKARKTFPQPVRRSPISDDSRVDLNGKNKMVYIPIQPPSTTTAVPARVMPNRPPVVNTSPMQRHSVTSTQNSTSCINTTTQTSTPAAAPAPAPLLTVATNLMPPSPVPPAPVPPAILPMSPQTPVVGHAMPAPNVVVSVPNNMQMQPMQMLSAFNGQWALCLPSSSSFVNVDVAPTINGLSDDSSSPAVTPVTVAQPRPVITAVPTSSLINTPPPPSREVSQAQLPPPLQARPGHPLDADTPVGPLPVPSEAGPCTSQLNQAAVKLADYFRTLLTESFEVLEDPTATVASLRLQLEAAAWKHKQELAELKHNTDVQLIEMRSTIEREKASAVAEARRQAEVELNQSIAQAKSKTWCANCRQEAQFYCCWNTSYCDYPCQQAHWTKHMNVCTQTRNPEAANEDNTTLKTIGGKTVVARNLNISGQAIAQTTTSGVMMNVQPSDRNYKRTQFNQPAYLINKQLMNSEEASAKITPGGYLIVGGSNTGRPVVSHGSNSGM